MTPATAFRFFFPLPDRVAIPDGQQFTEAVGKSSDVHGQPGRDVAVTVTYHQVVFLSEAVSEPVAAVVAALHPELADALPDDVAPALRELSAQATPVTVVEAFVAVPAADPNPDAARSAFEPCVRLVADHVRAFRLAADSPVAVPTVVQAWRDVVVFCSVGERVMTAEAVETRTVGLWTFLPINRPTGIGAVRAGPVEPVQEQFAYWMRELRVGNPLLAWRDQLYAAHRARCETGDFAGTVLHCATACEVFLDGVLLLLLWEDRVPADEAAGKFREGQTLRRVTGDLAFLLKGVWRTDEPGAVRDWHQSVRRVRNRVVHTAYTPSLVEADAALAATYQLERFVFDRLAAQRNRYMRSTLITVAPAGLDARGLWNGKIRRFAEDGSARNEPNWQTDFRSWRDQVSATIM